MQMNQYILEQVEVYLTDTSLKENFAEMDRGCREQGIGMRIVSAGSIENVTKEMALSDKKDCLFITDDVRIYQILNAEKRFVLVYLHAMNYGISFPEAPYLMEHPEELGVEYLERIFRRFRHLPWNILETQHCAVRETVEEDVPYFFNIYKEPQITEYMEGLYPTVEEETEYTTKYRKYMYEFYEHGVWTVLYKETGEIMGRAGIAVRQGYEEPEICFMTAVPFQRKGYTMEVVKAVMEYGRENFGYEQYIAFSHPENEVSKHLLERLGFFCEEKVILAVEEEGGNRDEEFLMYRWKA